MSEVPQSGHCCTGQRPSLSRGQHGRPREVGPPNHHDDDTPPPRLCLRRDDERGRVHSTRCARRVTGSSTRPTAPMPSQWLQRVPSPQTGAPPPPSPGKEQRTQQGLFNGSNVITRRARPGLAGLGPHTIGPMPGRRGSVQRGARQRAGSPSV